MTFSLVTQAKTAQAAMKFVVNRIIIEMSEHLTLRPVQMLCILNVRPQ